MLVTRNLRRALAIGATTGAMLACSAVASAQTVPPNFDGTNATYRIMAGSNLRTGDRLLDKIVYPLVKSGEVRGAGRCTEQSCPVIYEGTSVYARRSRLTLSGPGYTGGQGPGPGASSGGYSGSGSGSAGGAQTAVAAPGAGQSIPPNFDGTNATSRIMAGSNLRNGDRLLDKIVFPLIKGGEVRGTGRCTENSCPVAYEGNNNVYARRSRLSMPGGSLQITRTLRRGDMGEDVRLLQETLNKLGARIEVDGNYGRGTLAAVSDFQRNKGLDTDGVAGPRTLRALGV